MSKPNKFEDAYVAMQNVPTRDFLLGVRLKEESWQEVSWSGSRQNPKRTAP